MIRYVIRHKPTGGFLPQSSNKRNGYTHDEPVTMESKFCPRLFARAQDAKTALTWWLKGETRAKWTGGMFTNAFGEADDDVSFEWYTEACVDRKAEDMEVVATKMEFSDGIR